MLKEDNQAVWNFLKMADILPEVVLVQCTHFMSLSFFKAIGHFQFGHQVLNK